MAYGTLITQGILGSAASIAGPNLSAIALAVGTAFDTWNALPGNLVVSGSAIGTAGPTGKVLGRMSFPPAASLLAASLVGKGIAGPLAAPLAQAVAQGLSLGLVAASYSGNSPGVAAGTDTAHVSLANEASLTQALVLALSAALGGQGPLLVPLAGGLGQGIASMLLLGTGPGIVTGVPTVPAIPAAGISLSSVV